MDMMDSFETPGEEFGEGEAMSMDDSELVSILGQYEAQAIGYAPGGEDEIGSQIERALNYYYGEMSDLPAQDGSSSVTDRTVQTVIDSALAAVLKPFVSSDETVMFAPRGPEDVEFAEQATEYINYVVNCDNPGFLIFHDWFKDALLSKRGIVKAWWESETRLEHEGVQIESEEHGNFVRMQPNYLGEQDGIAYIGQQVEDGRVKIVNVPPEEFRISPFARGNEVPIYSAHEPQDITRSDLIGMGFDAEIVESLPADHSTMLDSAVRQARYEDEMMVGDGSMSPDPALDRIAFRDEYAFIDYDGDGVAEFRRIMRVDDVILYNEEFDEEEYPFASVCPVPMPHKFYGLSLADLVIEDQKINTVLWRQMLDNLYKSNNPRPVLGDNALCQDGSTEETLSDGAPGAAIRVRDVSQFRFDAVPYTADASTHMLDMVRNRIEEKTGVSLAGQGLDTNALRKSGQMTATEMAMIQGGKNARIEMIARIFAETGVKSLFKLLLHLVTKYQPKERMIRLRNQWVPMDPRGWPEMDVEISVGLGIGEKGEQIAVADGILETQAALAQSPYAQMVTPENVFNAVRKKLNAGGVKNVEDFIGDPSQMEQQEQKPDPEMQKAQAEMQMQAAKLQGEQQLQAAKLEMQREEAAQKQQLEREKAEFEAQMATQKMEAEMALAVRKMEMEAELAQHKAALDAHVRVETAPDLSTNRPGGKLDE